MEPAKDTGPPLGPQGCFASRYARHAFGVPLTPEPLRPLRQETAGRPSLPDLARGLHKIRHLFKRHYNRGLHGSRGLTILLLVTTASVVAFQQRSVAQTQRDNAIFSQIIVQADRFRSTDVSLAAQLNLTAYRMRSTPDLYTSLLTMENTALSTLLASHTDSVYSVVFSPDGRTLASSSADNTVRLWNVADPAGSTPLGQPLTGHTSIVRAVVFSLDGRTLATASGDRTVRLWNVADPAGPTPLGQPLTGHISSVNSVVFSPDGRTLASSSADRTTRLWEMNVDRVIQRICATTANILIPARWERYVSPDLPYRPPCP